MNHRLPTITVFLFGSGLCALIYQVAWMRELGLIFGASTAASAAVLAIFMGGLGVGGIFLGRLADRHSRPLVLYARLEMFISLSAALTPFLIWGASELYVMVGGSVVLGLTGATVVRLLLSAIILGVPAVLMGGTLPAAARSVETDEDVSRRRLAILYGLNTLGAVTGALLSTFILLESLGIHRTLWLACLLNSGIALTAWWLGERADRTVKAAIATEVNDTRGRNPEGSGKVGGQARWILAAAGIVGFVFFLMELVWYRMLNPLLGGSTYTFGLILAIALLGIGLGGAAYSVLWRNRPATFSGLAATCAIEAAFIALPLGLGDRLAVFAALLKPLATLGFSGHLIGWTLITFIVVLPAAFMAGIQFPLLIALLGQGASRVGRHTGLAYAWNTGGAILGSLAGGFGLMPLLGAVGTWRAGTALLVLTAIVFMVLSRRTEKRQWSLGPSLAALGAAVLMMMATGPTAVWRHSAIGAGRIEIGTTRNELHDWMNARRRNIIWEAEGTESSMALSVHNGYNHLNNGKSDGNVKGDAPTLMMIGLMGGFLHPNPQSSMVVGLGTGTSAGWLAAIPSMQKVDVVELEPATLKVARRCALANKDVINNPKVNISIGDAREFLLTTSEQYDLIVSQPSNPYRTGVANLFTLEFYESARRRLKPGGMFLQWVQSYECDVRTIRTIYGTLTSAFDVIETWQTTPDDLLLVCANDPIRFDVPTLRQRLTEEPYKSGTQFTLRAVDLEGLMARYVGNTRLAVAMADHPGATINTDDRNVVEYAFARTIGQDYHWYIQDLRTFARREGADRPALTGDTLNWKRVDDQYLTMFTMQGFAPPMPAWLDNEQRRRAQMQIDYLQGRPDQAITDWESQSLPPSNPMEIAMIADALAELGDEGAIRFIEQLAEYQPTEANAILSHFHQARGNYRDASFALVAALQSYRTDPWASTVIMRRAVKRATTLAAADSSLASPLYEAIRIPFALYILNSVREFEAVSVATKIDLPTAVRAMEVYEPNIPWAEEFLLRRMQWYTAVHHPSAPQAIADWEEFQNNKSHGLFDSYPGDGAETAGSGEDTP